MAPCWVWRAHDQHLLFLCVVTPGCCPPPRMFSPVRSARPPLRCLSSAVRLLHTTAPRREAVKLEYEAYPAPSDKEARSAAQAIVLCHGLL